MSDSKLAWFRWITIVPVALFATVVVQVGTQSVFLTALLAGFGRQSWTIWAAKSIAAPFMGAVFVAVVCWLAPRRKVLLGSLALVAVVVWGVTLMVGSFEHGFLAWLFAMGLSGVVGATLTFEVARRSSSSRPA